uniref:hypothetical protein n=1 Tax=Aeromonas sp. Ne-1 TaxID=1675689 RepID=UPI001563DAAF|nr:hypothetical protein [Aeromonas sp. Ne-1]
MKKRLVENLNYSIAVCIAVNVFVMFLIILDVIQLDYFIFNYGHTNRVVTIIENMFILLMEVTKNYGIFAFIGVFAITNIWSLYKVKSNN